MGLKPSVAAIISTLKGGVKGGRVGDRMVGGGLPPLLIVEKHLHEKPRHWQGTIKLSVSVYFGI